MQKNNILPIRKLEKVGFAQILLYLYINNEKDSITGTELREKLKIASDTITNTIQYLKADALITETETKKFPFMHILKLTEKGLKVAKPLAEFAAAFPEVQETSPKHP